MFPKVSQSTNRIRAPRSANAFAVETKVKLGTMISSPGPVSSRSAAISRECVQLVVRRVGTPKSAPRKASHSFVKGPPLEVCPCSTARVRMLEIPSKWGGLLKGMRMGILRKLMERPEDSAFERHSRGAAGTHRARRRECLCYAKRKWPSEFRLELVRGCGCLLYTSDAADEEDSVDIG